MALDTSRILIDPQLIAPPTVGVRGLSRSFDGRGVLRDINLSVRRGELVALLGRSGSGKSTLLRILAGLDDGYDGAVDVPERRAVVFQDSRLLPWLDVARNVTLGLRGNRRMLNLKALDALGEVGLGTHALAWPKTLSGEAAQRVALARALVREPELLLLDEPFGALDALTRIEMHTLLRALCAKHRPASLLVTHDVDEALVLADRIIVLTDGFLSLDLDVDLPAERRRSAPAFTALRNRLLLELGIQDRR
jgi:sulfonate transport system ATP-binding protein